MALTPVRKLVGGTGASGANGFTVGLDAHQTAIASAVTTAKAVTGVVNDSITVSSTQVLFDAVLFEYVTAINYSVNS